MTDTELNQLRRELMERFHQMEVEEVAPGSVEYTGDTYPGEWGPQR